MGTDAFPAPAELFITADGGGSNGYRTRLWKVALQDLADEIGLKLTVSHFPPGTSKWNKMEHRLVQLHHPELARQAVGECSSDRQPDRCYANHQVAVHRVG